MVDPEELKRCPQCGCTVAPSAGLLLCPFCVLTGQLDDSEVEESDHQRMGSYTLIEEIARGGMGVVYRARQDGLKRIVALKVLPGAAFASAEFRQRFQREAETVARLSHPGIVSVHEIGQAQGQPFISMDFIDGPSLAERLNEGKVTSEFSAHLVREVAHAVEHAHRNGVAHRDLKPSNILIAPDNHPVLTDFGLARFMDLESTRGNTLDLMGSPPYLPPERVTSGANKNPVAEDVYGLGAVLYHCLTGRPPFVADSLNSLLAAVSEGDPLAPSRLNPSVPQDLETICLKCLEKSPASRYASAADVADDLDRFLRGEPIHARPLSPLGHLVKLVRRKPFTAFLIFALAATIVSGTMFSVLAWRSAAASAADYRAVAEKRRVDLYSANLSAATAAMESGNRNQARELLARCKPTAGDTDLRGCEWSVLDQLLQSRELCSIKAHDHVLTALAWHPDGETLLSGGHDGSLKSWKREDGRGLIADREIIPSGNGRIQQVQWIDSGSAFLAAEGDFIRCRKPGVDTPLWEIPGVRFSLAADGRTLAVSTGQLFFFEPVGKISLWRLDQDVSLKPEQQRTFPFPARAVAISPDGRWLAAGLPKHTHHDEERDLDLFDLTLPDATPRHLETNGAIQSLEFSPDSTRLVATNQNETSSIHCFEVMTGNAINPPVKHSARVWAAIFTADSKSLLTTSSDRSLCLSPLEGGTPSQLSLAHDNEIWAAAIHPSGKEVATGDKDGNLKIHPLPLPHSPVAAFPRNPHFRYAVPVFSPDSSILYVCETAPKWETFAWNPEAKSKHQSPFALYPEGIDPMRNTACRDVEQRQLFHITDSSPPITLAIPPETWPDTPSMHNHGTSADRHHVYQFSETGHALTLHLATRSIRTAKNFCKTPPTASALSPGGRFLAAADWQELVIHDFDTGKNIRLPNDPHWARNIAFSPDGKLMASGGVDGHIILRELPNFTVIRKLSGHLSEVSGLAFSPDGRTLVSSEIGTGLRFWRLDTYREVLRLPLPEVCENLVFSPDGQKLAITTCPPASVPEKGQLLVIPCPRGAAE